MMSNFSFAPGDIEEILPVDNVRLAEVLSLDALLLALENPGDIVIEGVNLC